MRNLVCPCRTVANPVDLPDKFFRVIANHLSFSGVGVNELMSDAIVSGDLDEDRLSLVLIQVLRMILFSEQAQF